MAGTTLVLSIRSPLSFFWTSNSFERGNRVTHWWDFADLSVGAVYGKLFSQTNRFPDTRVAWYSHAQWLPLTTFKETSHRDPPP